MERPNKEITDKQGENGNCEIHPYQEIEYGYYCPHCMMDLLYEWIRYAEYLESKLENKI